MKKKIRISEQEIKLLPLAKLVIAKGWNPRWNFDPVKEEELLNSIIENGIKFPITVYQDKDSYVVIDGERRVKACRAAVSKGYEVAGVPAFVEEKPEGEKGLYITLVANDGRPLLPVEEAYAFDRLRKDGERIEDIARKIGRTTTVVSSRLALLKTSPAVKEAVNSGKIGVTLAAKVAKKSEKEQDSLIKKDKGEIKKELGLEHKKFSFPRRQVADEIDGWIEESFLSYDIGNAESLEIVIDDLVIRLEKILKKGI